MLLRVWILCVHVAGYGADAYVAVETTWTAEIAGNAVLCESVRLDGWL